MIMIMFVLDDPERLNEVIEAWHSAGIQGGTILESTGMHRVRAKFIPLRYVNSLFTPEENHLTLFAIVPDDTCVQAALDAIENVVGDLNDGNTGIFAAWPLTLVKGLQKDRV